MSALLRHLNHSCYSEDTRMSTRNKSPSLSVTYSGYNECTFGPRASKRFPLWRVHPLDEKPARMSSSSSYPTEINGLESSRTCRTLCSTNVEPPGRLSCTMPIPILAQCSEFPNPRACAHSSVVSRTFGLIRFSMDNILGLSINASM